MKTIRSSWRFGIASGPIDRCRRHVAVASDRAGPELARGLVPPVSRQSTGGASTTESIQKEPLMTLMDADNEDQRMELVRAPGITFCRYLRGRMKLPMFPIISGHQRSSAVLSALSRFEVHSLTRRCENPPKTFLSLRRRLADCGNPSGRAAWIAAVAQAPSQ